MYDNGHWQGFLPAGSGFSAVGCSGIDRELHVCAVDGNGDLMHNIPSWNKCGDRPIAAVACGTVVDVAPGGTTGGMLHACITRPGGELLHSFRLPDGIYPVGYWQGFLPAGSGFSTVGCSGIDDELHVCAVDGNGDLMHNIPSWNKCGDRPIAAVACGTTRFGGRSELHVYILKS
jgi:hypothetical protein